MGGFLFFSNYRMCVDVSGSFDFFLAFFHNVYPFWVIKATEGVRVSWISTDVRKY